MVPKKSKGGCRFVSVLHTKSPPGLKVKTNQALVTADVQASVQPAVVKESKPVFQKTAVMSHQPPLPTPPQPVKVSAVCTYVWIAHFVCLNRPIVCVY
jgi:hypothetical protein